MSGGFPQKRSLNEDEDIDDSSFSFFDTVEHQPQAPEGQDIVLTEQQKEIINFAPLPGQCGKILRVTAGELPPLQQ